mgnify:CR=1 FL=1
MNNTATITPAAASGPQMDWVEPSLADRDKRPLSRALVDAVVLICGALVDAGLMRPAIMRVLRDTPEMATVISVALALVGATAAAAAGSAWRGARGNQPGRRAVLVMPGLLGLFWLGLGLGIGWVRVGAASITATTQYDGQAATTGSASQADLIAAGVFLLVYVLVGMLAANDAYQWRNDAFTAKVNAQKKLGAARKNLSDTEALLVRLVENLQIRKHELATNPTDATNAKQANQALARELEQVSRVEQMIHQRDVTKSGITSSKHPDNPYPSRA